MPNPADFEHLLSTWNEHQALHYRALNNTALRHQGATIAELSESRARLDDARLQVRSRAA